MKRRKFIKAAAVAGGATAVAASTFPITSVLLKSALKSPWLATWPRDFPGLGTGAQRFAKRLSDMTDGRMNVKYYAAGERVKAF